ncbi:hypothetical protein P5673_025712 [Acropora cervicornis]|uniref:Uncharacterized protein n=1 Tax=Acropora cervicornis TaxID=6130 RepID=A0AAD9Q1E4_ACRCE|nr:hypothetical protein P5673_025712 [Acropora cervicornis]
MLQCLPAKDETLCQIQNFTQQDAILKTLAGIIKQGWPERRGYTSERSYFQERPCQEDAILETLAGVIKQGCLESKLCLLPEVQDYFPFKEKVTLQNGVFFKGDRVIIPFQMRAHSELKRKLNSSHLGVQACQRQVREAF